MHVIPKRTNQMKPITYLSLFALTSLLGACAGDSAKMNTAEVRNLPQSGSEFQQNLHSNYAALGKVELDESHQNAESYYNTKARQAAAGANVQPTRLEERTIPGANVAELSDARSKLMNVIGAGGPQKAPVQTARAQTMFDCWMEEQEENFQPADIALCRDGFHAALDQAATIVYAAAPAPARVAERTPPPPPAPETTIYTVYFNHNSDELDEKALAQNREIVERIKSTGIKTVMVNGYADRSGDREYNRKLAERRAAVVAEALAATGISPVVGTESFGEDRLAVQTLDDVREWQNRRVVITVQQ
jgi:OOP family OmpA-OmpF porin